MEAGFRGGSPLPCEARRAEVAADRGAGAGEERRTGLWEGVRLGVLAVLACFDAVADAAAAFLLALAEASAAAAFAFLAATRSLSSSSVSLDSMSESISMPPVVNDFFLRSMMGFCWGTREGEGAEDRAGEAVACVSVGAVSAEAEEDEDKEGCEGEALRTLPSLALEDGGESRSAPASAGMAGSASDCGVGDGMGGKESAAAVGFGDAAGAAALNSAFVSASAVTVCVRSSCMASSSCASSSASAASIASARAASSSS